LLLPIVFIKQFATMYSLTKTTEQNKMNESIVNEIMNISAQAAVELFAKEGVKPTQENVTEWVLNNWEALSYGMALGVSMAAA
jgi:hypothetical protein